MNEVAVKNDFLAGELPLLKRRPLKLTNLSVDFCGGQKFRINNSSIVVPNSLSFGTIRGIGRRQQLAMDTRPSWRNKHSIGSKVYLAKSLPDIFVEPQYLMQIATISARSPNESWPP